MISKKAKLTILVVLVVCACVLMFFSCDKPIDTTKDNSSNIEDNLGSLDTSIDSGDVDSSYNENGATKIVFGNSNPEISGLGANAVGNDVTITTSGTFIIGGNCSDGSIVVDAGKGKEVQIVLNSLNLTNADGYAIYVKSGKKVTVTLKNGSMNTVADGESYSIIDDNTTLDAAIFSKIDLVINGSGSLTVNGNNAHGIVSKDNLTVTGGVLDIASKSAGICGKDSLKISGAQIKVNAGSDALRSDSDTDVSTGFIYIQSGKFDLTAKNDAIQAFTIVSIDGGEFKIKTTSTLSSESAKAIKGGTGVKISNGTFVIDAEDDALHSNGDILVAGGDFSIYSGDDGVHADGTLEIKNGNIVINNSVEGIEGTHIAISGGYVDITSSDDGMNASGGNDTTTNASGRPGMDMFEETDGSITISGGYVIVHNEGDGVDSNGSLEISGGVLLVDGPSRGGNGSFDYATTAKITGGVVITLGTSDMAQNFTEATQGTTLVRSGGSFAAGTLMSICDENGNVILAFRSTKSFNGALFSAPELEKGKTYTFYMNADVQGLDENGFAHNTTQTGGEECGTVTLDDYISGQGSGMPGGGRPGGGGPGGRPW